MNSAILLILSFLFAIWNGLVIKWYLSRKQIYSTLWHGVGFIIRALPVLLIYPDWLFVLLYLNVSWTAYDMIINIINGWNLFYIGKTSTFDRVFGKWLYICKAILLLFTIYYLAL